MQESDGGGMEGDGGVVRECGVLTAGFLAPAGGKF